MLLLRSLQTLASILTISVLGSCEKTPETITNTVVQIDTVYIEERDTIILTNYIQDSATTFILSRHAETTGVGSDPVLSSDGQTRALELARVLKNVKFNGVYSTNFNRTKQTAAQIATDNGVSVDIYDPSKLTELADSIIERFPQGAVYIAGHSNTTNVMLNVLIGSSVYQNIPDTQYDNLYIVSVYKRGHAKVTHLKYGKL